MNVYGHVYRQNTPAGWKGRLCRVVTLSPQRRDWLLRGEVYTGESLIGIEFDNGEMACVQRQSIVPVRSRMGWAAIRNAGKPAKQYKTRSEAQVERYAKARGETV